MEYRPPDYGTGDNREPTPEDHLLRLEILANAYKRGRLQRWAATLEWAAAEIRTLRARLEPAIAETRKNA